MTKIKDDNDFQRKYNTVENYKKYLIDEAKVVGKETSEGKISKEDVEKQANDAKEVLYMLEVIDEDEEVK